MHREESIEIRSEQIKCAEILYRSIDEQTTIIQSLLQKLSSILSRHSDSALEPASKYYSDDQLRDELGRWTTGSPGKNEMYIDGATTFLDKRTEGRPLGGKGECATYVKEAIEAGGVTLEKHPRRAKDYYDYLNKYFDKVTPTPSPDYSPQKGDIAVFKPPPVHKNQDGHIQMYIEEEWASDFKQGKDKRYFWPGPDYRSQKPPYVIYRPKDWKPPKPPEPSEPLNY